MIDGIPAEVITQGGAWTIIAIGILAIIRGMLVPRSMVEKLLAVYDELLRVSDQRGDDWRDIANTNTATIKEHGAQLEQLLEGNRTNNAILESIRQTWTRGGRGPR